MKKPLTILASAFVAIASFAADNVPQWAATALDAAQKQAEDMYRRVRSERKLPRSIAKGLQGPEDWTAGFFPGELWMLYEFSGDSLWRKRAEDACAILEGQQFNASDHDIGFKMQCSYGRGLDMTGRKDYAAVLDRSAHTLASRFSPRTGLIQSWEADPGRDWLFPVIIDNMMNLELLMEANHRTGDTRLRDIAVSHADKTMACHYRPDMTCPHVVDYDPKTGEVRKFDWNNGSDNTANSTWARGQAWGLYGYTMMYRQTGDRRYLAHAERIADMLLAHPALPADMVPYWDYTGADRSEMRDAAAAALMASALMELSRYSTNGPKYFSAGEKQLKSLASPEYLAAPGTHDSFLIKHATGNYLRNSELDGGLSYADYYFVEGLLRYLKVLDGKQLYHNGRLGEWFVEAHSPETVVAVGNKDIEIITPKGFTMWYDRPLSGRYTISYDAMLPEKGGKHDRASDLNCFWGARDPQNPGDIYANANYRQGFFPHYKTMELFYVGYGGNYNSTTRFRKYYGGGPDVDDSIARPVIGEYTDEAHLLKPNRWFHIEIKVEPGLTTYSINGEVLFRKEITTGEADGYFGFRLLENHTIIKNFRIDD